MGQSDSKNASRTIATTSAQALAKSDIFVAPPQSPDRVVGLDNYGNTCYCNATIQSMFHCRPLRDRLAELYEVLKGQRSVANLISHDIERGLLRPDGFTDDDGSDLDDEKEMNPSSPLSELNAPLASPPVRGSADAKLQQDTILFRLCELFDHMESCAAAGKKRVGPRSFVSKVKAENEMFRNSQQQDAHEFVMFVLNTIMEEERTLLGVKGARPVSPLQAILAGVTVTRTYCGECDTKTSISQQFVDVNIDVAPNTSLRHCGDLYSAYETLTGDDKFRCNACTSPVDARRRILFRRLPVVLVVQLKRFSYSERAAGFTKRSDRVAFAETMTLVTVSGEDVKYDLCGVVVHHGATPNLGHYVAIVQNVNGGKWYRCDDDTATPFAPRDLQRYFGTSEALHDPSLVAGTAATAYLLFYSRCAT